MDRHAAKRAEERRRIRKMNEGKVWDLLHEPLPSSKQSDRVTGDSLPLAERNDPGDIRPGVDRSK